MLNGIVMLLIRTYKDDDLEAVRVLHNLALTHAGAHAGSGPWDDDFHQIQRVYLDAGGEFLVGLIDNRIVAMGALKRTSETRAEIKRMRVHPDFHRRGLGQQILHTLEARAAVLGYAYLHLDTTANQEAAQSLYIKNGYVEVRREHWRGMEMIFYEKRLA